MLDVRRLRLLRELAYRGTIAAVADALSFTPSAVSQQLAVLEREAGVGLIERSGRRVSITPAGHGLIRHAEVVLAELERAAAELAAARQASGPVRIGTFATAAQVIVPAALRELAVACPGIEPMVTELDPAHVASALRAGELDLALVQEYDFVPAATAPGLSSRPLCREHMYLAVAAGQAAAEDGAPADAGQAGAGAADSPAGLGVLAARADQAWITATPGTLCHAMTIRACQIAGFEPRVRHQVDDFGTVLTLVAAGHGSALVPELAIAAAPAGVMLRRLPVRRHTRIACRRGAERHPAVAAVSAALLAAVPAALREVASAEGAPGDDGAYRTAGDAHE